MRGLKQRMLWAWAVIGGLIVTQACTKTEQVPYEKEPLNKVLSFTVTNAQQELIGAIDQKKNTITVYVPYYIAVAHLVVDMKIDDGARLLDSTGVEINLDGGLDPIRVGDSVKYTVESKDGIKRPYTLLQRILPHEDVLKVSISGVAEDVTLLEKPVYGRLTLLGNFESTSRNAKFYLTDKATGQVHTDYIRVITNIPGATYTMDVDISAEAKAGEYDVRMEHQGRSVNLPSLKLYYNKPYVPMFLSSSQYAPGDTILFEVNRLVPSMDMYATAFVGLKNIYMKIPGTPGTNLPANFPTNLIDTKIPMKLVSYTGMVAKAIFPDIPDGIYIGAYTQPGGGGGTYYLPPAHGISFYADYDEQTNWGNDVFLASQIWSAGGFTVLPKP